MASPPPRLHSPSASIAFASSLDPHTTTDITSLADPITTEQVAALLRARFLLDSTYTSLSPSCVVSVNPCKFVQSNSDASLAQYAAEYREDISLPGASKVQLPPHVWQLANRALYYMRRTGQDQSIIFSGEVGSGKSECRRLAIKSLVELTAPPTGKKGSKLTSQIPSAEFILECFGHASTLTNTNASRFGRYTELQFSEKGRIMGVKGLEYYLERSRVTNPPSGERNFHVLHYLVAGASQDERSHLKLEDSNFASYRYLTSSQRNSNSSFAASDASKFVSLKNAFKTVGFPKRAVASLFQILAAILHLGNLDFVIDRDRNVDSAVVRNTDLLEHIAGYLGVSSSALESVLTYKTALINGETCTVFLDPEGCMSNTDDLARVLYGLTFSWLNEFLNEKLCRDDFATFVSLVDFPGPQKLNTGSATRSAEQSLDAFCFNLASETARAFTLARIFEDRKEEYRVEELTGLLPGLNVTYPDNKDCVRLLSHVPGGLVHIIDDQSKRRGKTDATMVEAMGKRWGNNSAFDLKEPRNGSAGSFTCSHWSSHVTYNADGFLERNSETLSTDLIHLFAGESVTKGPKDAPGHNRRPSGSSDSFIRGLFVSKALTATISPRDEETVVAAQQSAKPMRAPSTRRKKSPYGADQDDGEGAGESGVKEEGKAGKIGVVGEYNASLSTLFQTLKETKSWFVFTLLANEGELPNQVDPKLLRQQISQLGIAEMATRLKDEWTVSVEHKEWWSRYSDIPGLADVKDQAANQVWKDKFQTVKKELGWDDSDIAVGKFKAFLSDRAFRELEDALRNQEGDDAAIDMERIRANADSDPFSPYPQTPRSPVMGGYGEEYSKTGSTMALPLVNRHGGAASAYTDDDDAKTGFTGDPEDDYMSKRNDAQSLRTGSEMYAPSKSMFNDADKKALAEKEAEEAASLKAQETVEVAAGPSTKRKQWVAIVWALTFWMPPFLLSWIGGMKRPDVRQAWREKLAINMIIWFMCGCAVFVIAILGNLICPKEYVFSVPELNDRSFTNNIDSMLVSIRGEVFDLTGFAPLHHPSVVTLRNVQKYGGTDATNLFPVQVSALCGGVDGNVSPWVTLDALNTTAVQDPNSIYHDFRAGRGLDYRPDWYYEQMIYMRYNFRKGFVGYTPTDVSRRASITNTKNTVIYRGSVYDMTGYISSGGGGVLVPPNTQAPGNINRQFMASEIVDIFTANAGQDITNRLDSLNLDADVMDRQMVCLRNLFFIGHVDSRNSPKCLFSQYILLAFSIVMVAVIGSKFLAALQFGKSRSPEDHDKFVICQVPCYTEGEESLRKCLESLAALRYDDKRKLLFVICDGNIVGSGNDKPTPRIVLDVLGCDPALDPEPLSFLSLGDGAKQHNMAKVYSGLYEFSGHVVPYVVFVKVGKPTERSRPGNRGKRDSQMVLMRFLNRVHFDAPMSPCELELYHQIKNVIGVNPSFYEFLLAIDADTTVDPLSLNRLISAMTRDRKVMGMCGETSLANAKQSFTTMMQVYEYFISHYLAKAFESLFGTVTCLPGCFSLYRLRTLDHRPLLISNDVVVEFGVNIVDTLHLKNLLHLGEDRYLTTLLLKHFPNFKTVFCRDAFAKTIAPDEWKVLLSQRRRWINSTIHNLFELFSLDRLCGFCCFSMRFVVFIDLLSTIISPVSVAYIVYLIYLVAAKGQAVPTTSIILIAAIYGLQAIIFILHRKFEHIGWMIVYILAIPLFSFYIPLYSFWRMDSFSWGATRTVQGESGKKLVIHDEGPFDPSAIPLKRWQDYENELWERGSNQSIGSLIEASKREKDGVRDGSIYGYESVYDPIGARSQSRSPMPFDQRSDFGGQAYRSALNSLNPSPRGSAYFGPSSARNSGMFGAGTRSVNDMASLAGGGESIMMREQTHAPTASVMSFPVPFGATPYGSTPYLPTMGGLPTDEQVSADIRAILANADLNTITKKGVRQELEQRYGVELGPKKDFVNREIERALGY